MNLKTDENCRIQSEKYFIVDLIRLSSILWRRRNLYIFIVFLIVGCTSVYAYQCIPDYKIYSTIASGSSTDWNSRFANTELKEIDCWFKQDGYKKAVGFELKGEPPEIRSTLSRPTQGEDRALQLSFLWSDSEEGLQYMQAVIDSVHKDGPSSVLVRIYNIRMQIEEQLSRVRGDFEKGLSDHIEAKHRNVLIMEREKKACLLKIDLFQQDIERGGNMLKSITKRLDGLNRIKEKARGAIQESNGENPRDSAVLAELKKTLEGHEKEKMAKYEYLLEEQRALAKNRLDIEKDEIEFIKNKQEVEELFGRLVETNQSEKNDAVIGRNKKIFEAIESEYNLKKKTLQEEYKRGQKNILRVRDYLTSLENFEKNVTHLLQNKNSVHELPTTVSIGQLEVLQTIANKEIFELETLQVQEERIKDRNVLQIENNKIEYTKTKFGIAGAKKGLEKIIPETEEKIKNRIAELQTQLTELSVAKILSSPMSSSSIVQKIRLKMIAVSMVLGLVLATVFVLIIDFLLLNAGQIKKAAVVKH